jgi:diguanylate cyclase (GGDEF)-like protein
MEAEKSATGAAEGAIDQAEGRSLSTLADAHKAVLRASSVAELCEKLQVLVGELLHSAKHGTPRSRNSEAALKAFGETLERRISDFNQASGSEAERALRESEARFRSLADLGSDWYWEQDERLRFTRFEGRFPTANRAAFSHYIGHAVWDLGLEAEKGWESLRQIMHAHQPFRDFIHSRILRNASRRWFTASGDPVFTGGKFVGYRGVGRDITAEKLAEEQVWHRATHDSLTGLANRAMFSALLERALHSARRYSRHLALLFIDLDGFKAINDKMGHETGDHLLQQIAVRFLHAVRTSDVVVRLGGDEFVVLVPEVQDRAHLAPLAQKLLAAARAPFHFGDRKCKVTSSIGIAVFPEDGESEPTLMKAADRAMYAAKRAGKDLFQFCS